MCDFHADALLIAFVGQLVGGVSRWWCCVYVGRGCMFAGIMVKIPEKWGPSSEILRLAGCTPSGQWQQPRFYHLVPHAWFGAYRGCQGMPTVAKGAWCIPHHLPTLTNHNFLDRAATPHLKIAAESQLYGVSASTISWVWLPWSGRYGWSKWAGGGEMPPPCVGQCSTKAHMKTNVSIPGCLP